MILTIEAIIAITAIISIGIGVIVGIEIGAQKWSEKLKIAELEIEFLRDANIQQDKAIRGIKSDTDTQIRNVIKQIAEADVMDEVFGKAKDAVTSIEEGLEKYEENPYPENDIRYTGWKKWYSGINIQYEDPQPGDIH